ncbi:MAG TPA: Clp protease N-terminal domain-containing protein [Bryobacteraceae bacterium]|nr:Clp protease N-terminal domain-containing protein [Bryobacteraceae bacterium]
MFERYTETARRTIFFARYEASQFGSYYIETEHLLLGLLHEDRVLSYKLPPGAGQHVRRRIEERTPKPIVRSTSVDLPLGQDSKRALVYAAEESTKLKHPVIDGWHLALGLLRLSNSTGAALLRELGVEYDKLREAPPDFTQPTPRPAPEPAKGPMARVLTGLQMLSLSRLLESQPLKRSPLTRKQALGHLVDWAAAHQQWFARALTEGKLTAAGYPGDSWLAAQGYIDLPWAELVQLCVSLNGLLAHVIDNIPAEKMMTPCRIDIAEPIPLGELVRRYIAHCEDIVGQLLMRG